MDRLAATIPHQIPTFMKGSHHMLSLRKAARLQSPAELIQSTKENDESDLTELDIEEGEGLEEYKDVDEEEEEAEEEEEEEDHVDEEENDESHLTELDIEKGEGLEEYKDVDEEEQEEEEDEDDVEEEGNEEEEVVSTLCMYAPQMDRSGHGGGVQGYTPRMNQSSHGGWDSVNGPVSPRRDILRDWTRTSYEILSLQPYLQVKEFIIAETALCGSNNIDKAFEAYIERLVGLEQYRSIDPKHKSKMLSDFEILIKRSFRVKHEQKKTILVDLRGVEENKNNGIEDESIILKPKELHNVFLPTCNRIRDLVMKQGDEIEEGHTLAFEAECAIQIRFGDIGHRRFCDVVLYCEKDDPPERCTSDVKLLGYLPWQVDCKSILWHEKRDSKAVLGGKADYKFKYMLQSKLGPASMKLSALYRGKIAGTVEIPYEGTDEIPKQ
ncbi:hypothetical protein BDD12DRAFT_910659 [Trichophaea hybrida]|nr:hypothetical protein BDD12DRAFT_910659 [Trichophaea hybrida]